MTTTDTNTTAPADGPVANLGPITVLPITAVHAAKDNPRKIPTKAVEIVARSLREFGWQQPLVIDGTGEIIAGHTRLLAAQALGLPVVPVTVAEHLTPAQVRAYRIADNRTSDFTTWDLPALAIQLEELSVEFADVLALADWEGIVKDFDALLDNATVDLSLEADEDLAIYAGEKYSLVVVLDSEGSARAFATAAVEMDGVLDVRDRRG